MGLIGRIMYTGICLTTGAALMYDCIKDSDADAAVEQPNFLDNAIGFFHEVYNWRMEVEGDTMLYTTANDPCHSQDVVETCDRLMSQYLECRRE